MASSSRPIPALPPSWLSAGLDGQSSQLLFIWHLTQSRQQGSKSKMVKKGRLGYTLTCPPPARSQGTWTLEWHLGMQPAVPAHTHIWCNSLQNPEPCPTASPSLGFCPGPSHLPRQDPITNHQQQGTELSVCLLQLLVSFVL